MQPAQYSHGYPFCQRRRLAFESLEDRTTPALIWVTSLDDNLNRDGMITLREAIQAAETDTSVDGSVAGSGADTIRFEPGLVAGGDQRIVLFSWNRENQTGNDSDWFGPTAFHISTPVQIAGPSGEHGVTLEAQQFSGPGNVDNTQRLFTVTKSGELTLENLTLQGGVARGGNGASQENGTGGGGGLGAGGAILNQGVLTLHATTFLDNLAVGGNYGGLTQDPVGGAGGGGGGMGANAPVQTDPQLSGAGGGPNGGAPGTGAGDPGGIGGGGAGGSVAFSGGAGGFGGGGGGAGNQSGSPVGGHGGFGAGGGAGGSPGNDNGPGGFAGGGGSGDGAGGGAGLGGAIFNAGGVLTMVNSTLTNNRAWAGVSPATVDQARGLGGAIFNLNGQVHLTNVTIVGNLATNALSEPDIEGGQALYSRAENDAQVTSVTGPASQAMVTLTNSILGQSGSGSLDVVMDGPHQLAGSHNLIIDQLGYTGDRTLTVDPQLGPLQDNGGPTPTMALLPTSPGVGVGTRTSAPGTDQRGQPRTPIIDLGAYALNVAGNTPSITITEIMFNPSSSEPAWEWIEIYNFGVELVDLTGWVLDNGDDDTVSGANLGEGLLAPGQTAILYNADAITAAAFEAAWGVQRMLIGVGQWNVALPLANSGDRIGLWQSATEYQGDHQDHRRSVISVDFGQFNFPIGNDQGSISLIDLEENPNLGANWAVSLQGEANAYQSQNAGGNSGNDIGSPGRLPPRAIRWVGSAGRWADLGNPGWDPELPREDDMASVQNGAIVTVEQNDAVAGHLNLGTEPTGAGSLQLTDAAAWLHISDQIRVGDAGGIGSIVQRAGNIEAGGLTIGLSNSATVGSYQLEGGSLVVTEETILGGDGGALATFTQTGGVHQADEIQLGMGSQGGTVRYTLSGGELRARHLHAFGHPSGNGMVNLQLIGVNSTLSFESLTIESPVATGSVVTLSLDYDQGITPILLTEQTTQLVGQPVLDFDFVGEPPAIGTVIPLIRHLNGTPALAGTFQLDDQTPLPDDTRFFIGANLVQIDYDLILDGDGIANDIGLTLLFDGTNRPPSITSDGGGDEATRKISENTHSITTLVAIDPDPGDILTFRLVGGEDGDAVTLDPVTGVLAFAEAPDFENPSDAGGDNRFQVIVAAADSQGASDTQTLTVEVLPVPEGPIVLDQSFTIAENPPIGSVLGTVQASDPDGDATWNFAISAGNPNGSLDIDASTGALTVADPTRLDYEQNPSMALEVTVSASPILSQTFDRLPFAGAETNAELPSGSPLPHPSGSNHGGPGLDFRTVWWDTRGNPTGGPVITQVDGDSSDWIGVDSQTGRVDLPDTAPDGSLYGPGQQYFVVNDPDGRLELTFEPIDVFAWTNRSISLSYYVNADNYEPGDTLEVRISDGNQIWIIESLGAAQLGERGDQWTTLAIDLESLIVSQNADPRQIQLILAVDTNGATETVVFDDIVVTGDPPADSVTASINVTVQDVLEIITLGPLDDAISVPVDTNLRMTFEQDVVANQGHIRVHRSADNTEVARIPLLDPEVTINGAEVAVTLGSLLEPGTPYHVLVDAGALGSRLDDTVVFPGIGDSGVWNFATEELSSNQPPVFLDQTYSVVENVPSGTLLDTLQASDPDPTDQLTFEVNGGNGVGVFDISSVGVLQVSDASGLVNGQTYTLDVTVRDDGLPPQSASGLVTIHITAAPGVVILDDGDAGYAETGSWSRVTGRGFDEDVRFGSAGGSVDTAHWRFSVDPGKVYRLAASWVPANNRATAAPFTIYDGMTVVKRISIDQQQAPDDFVEAGFAWEELLIDHTASSETLMVELQDATNGFVVADAIRLQEAVPSPALVIRPIGGLRTSELGTTDTFSIQLATPPSAEVTVSIAVDDPTEGSVSPSSLVFTPENFGIPQTVSVIGVDDLVDDGAVDYTVVTTVSSGDNDYIGINGRPVHVKNRDDDGPMILDDGQPGFTQTAGWTVFAGGFDNDVLRAPPGAGEVQAVWSFTVRPGQPVELAATWTPFLTRAADATYRIYDGSLNGRLLGTFVLNQRNAPNDFAEAGVSWEVLADVLVASSDTLLVELTNAANGVVIADALRLAPFQPSPGITLAPRRGLVTSEAGATTHFTVNLNTIPIQPVTVTLTSSHPAEGVVAPDQLLFLPENFGLQQTVTVTGLDDSIVDGDVAYQVNTVATSLDSTYAGRSGTPIEVVNQDDDGPTIADDEEAELIGRWGTARNGGLAGSYRFRGAGTGLASAIYTLPAPSNIPLELAVTWVPYFSRASNAPYSVFDGDPALANLLGSVTVDQQFSPDDFHADGFDWERLGTFTSTTGTLSVVQTDAADGVVITDAVRAARVPAGLAISADDRLETSESGRSTSFTVALQTAPIDTVTVTLTSDTPSEGQVTPAELVISADDYHVPRLVTVTGVDDDHQDGWVAYQIVLDTSSTDPDYHQLPPREITIGNHDNDGPILVDDRQANVVGDWRTAAGGVGGNYRFKTGDNGNSYVQFQLEVPVNRPRELATTWVPFFTRATNAQYQIFDGDPASETLLGSQSINQRIAPNDYEHTGVAFERLGVYTSRTGTLTVQLANVGNGMVVADAVRATPIPAGLVIQARQDLETSEAGGMLTLPIFLSTPPTAEVTVSIASSDSTEGTVTPVTIVFTPDNFAEPQRVTVTGVDDHQQDGDVQYQITTHAQSSDPAYAGKTGRQLLVDNRDDDQPLLIDETQANLIGGWRRANGGFAGTYRFLVPGEGNAQAIYTISVKPNHPVELAATWVPFRSRGTDVTYRIFDGTQADGLLLDEVVRNQQLPPDDERSGGIAFERLSVVRSTSGTLEVVLSDAANGVIIADAIRARTLPPGLLIEPSDQLTTHEAGGTATFRIHLTTQPIDTVTVSLASDNPTEGILDRSTLIFSPEEYDLPQTVTVIGVDDRINDGDVAYQIVTSARSADSMYNLESSLSVFLKNRDNDGPILIDDLEAAFRLEDDWAAFPGGFTGSYRYSPPGDGTQKAIFTATGLSPGTYRIWSTWEAYFNRGTQVPYIFYDGTVDTGTPLETVLVNQRIPPRAHVRAAGVAFQELTELELSGSILSVELNNLSDGLIIADAIRIELL